MWEEFFFTIEHSAYDNKWIAYGKKMMVEKDALLSAEASTLDKLIEEMRIAINYHLENF
jgi:hypothetical protein